ncbi:hypothetical protein BU23DRAFT_563919 [Bimuria novae-zelandiae CBS 107.79]|uniref:Uncharacterized protein n=1 Tax=Bimuria novae-zelandiae CBS 107.79 TaxID=1447943 RepID=A0A6A5VMY7_9PLEO|nr:hypothetical protein BU23DRAFT_563919 [Bimuria novae-zelandiae CBS 107.79]
MSVVGVKVPERAFGDSGRSVHRHSRGSRPSHNIPVEPELHVLKRFRIVKVFQCRSDHSYPSRSRLLHKLPEDQRLRSTQVSTGGLIKLSVPFNDAQITATTEALTAQIAASNSINTTDSAICYSGVLSTTTDNAVSTATLFNFSTSPLFDEAHAQPTYFKLSRQPTVSQQLLFPERNDPNDSTDATKESLQP